MMSHKMLPSMDALETRALLSTGPSGMTIDHAARRAAVAAHGSDIAAAADSVMHHALGADATVKHGIHARSHIRLKSGHSGHHNSGGAATPALPIARNGALTASLTTNQGTYQLGQVVQMTLTLTNDTSGAVRVGLGPSIDGFFIMQGSSVIWRSNSGFMPEYIVLRVLQPGQSFTLTAGWTATTTGTLTAHSQLLPSGPVATFQVQSISSHPVRHPTLPPFDSGPIVYLH